MRTSGDKQGLGKFVIDTIFHLHSNPIVDVLSFMELVLQVKRLRHREGKQLVLSHTASETC